MKKIRKHLKNPWPYWLGGLVLGTLNIALLGLVGFNWKVTEGFIFSGTWVLNPYLVLNIGVILGSFIATLLASQFKLKKIKNIKQILIGLIGGIMMGYGARLASGCNIGAFFSGIPSFSLHAWVFGIFMILGTGVGVRYLIRFMF